MGTSLLEVQVARDSALQKLSSLASSVGPGACAAAGVDVEDAGQADAVVRGHLERIAALEREVSMPVLVRVAWAGNQNAWFGSCAAISHGQWSGWESRAGRVSI